MTREDILDRYPKATENQIAATLAKYNEPPKDLETSFADMAKGVARSAGQGLTFGFGDELTALARSLFGAESYDELVEEERQALDDFREEHPGWAYGTEIAAGMVLPGGALKGGLTAARAAKVGAGTGGAYGAGAGEGNIVQRAPGAAVGAVLGGGLGAGGQKLSEVGSKYLRRRLGKRPGRQYRDAREQDLAVGRLQRDFKEQLETDDPARLAQMQAQGIPPSEAYRGDVTGRMAIADLPAMEGAGLGLSQKYGSVREIAKQKLTQRADSEYEELVGELRTSLRATERADDLVEKVQKITKKKEAPHYKKAGTIEIEASPWMEDVLFDPLIKGIYNKRRANVQTFVRNNRTGFGKDDLMPAWDDLIEVAKDGTKTLKIDAISTKHLHQLKQGLDKQANWAKSNTNAKEDAYRTLIRRINDELGKVNPSYKIANRINHLGHQVEKAADRGRKILTSNTSDTAVRKEINALSGAIEKKAFRSGILQGITNKVGDGSVGQYLSVPGRQNIKDALKATFPDEDAYNAFMVNARREGDFRNLETRAGLGGSQTVRAGEEAKKWESGGLAEAAQEAAVGAVAVSAPWAAAGFAKRYARTLAGVKDERVAREAANLIFTETPEEAQKAFDILLKTSRRLSGNDRKKLQEARNLLAGAATPVAGMIGGSFSQ